MKSEDRARLEVLRGSTYGDVLTLVRLIDEQAAEIAKLEWPGPGEDDKPLPEDAAIDTAFPTRSGSHKQYAEAMRLVGARRSKGGLVALVNWLLVQLTEERAKSATTNAEMLAVTTIPSIRAQEIVRFRERAFRAERELAEAQEDLRWAQRIRDVSPSTRRAEEAERRAEKAEARVAELEAWRTAQKEWEDIAVRTMTGLQTENAELQALVDAATAFRFGRVRVVKFGAGHWAVERMRARTVGNSGDWECVRSFSFSQLDEAIALARDLAAKEKEPK